MRHWKRVLLALLWIAAFVQVDAPAQSRTLAKQVWPEEELAAQLIERFKIGPACNDLRQRLARLSDSRDRFRVSRVGEIQHDPFQLRTVATRSLDQTAQLIARRAPAGILHQAAEWLDAPITAAPPLKTGLSLERHLDQLVDVLVQAQNKRREAFAALSEQDQRYLESNCDALFFVFSRLIDLQGDPDKERLQRNIRVLELASRVDFVKLYEGAGLLWRIGEDSYLDDLEAAVRRAWETAGKPDGIFIDRNSPAGRILVGGNGSTWYREDAAILLDLGGNDFYTNNAGSPRGDRLPAAVLVDFAGNDAYEATFDWAQSAARMGYAMLVDRKGNDSYIGRDWSQGAAVLGAALMLDETGNDVYRADQFSEGVAAWGIGVHLDYEGDDIYAAHLLSQGVGMPGGAGWLLNGNGNDSYYSKGTRPTGYGDAGIFDSWSQGSAIGFRGLQSGGVAVLYDGGGKDRYEAGNFSQGGGYYFGIGMLRDAGKEDDIYIGSRYNQGFAAHQAIGYFEEMGGNDFYTTRQAVAQGISWDETITLFIDQSGDDTYEGGAYYSQGASAHNGFCVFLDLGGRNRFAFSMPQAAAGPNDYHGGASLSLFVAADDKGNVYNSGRKPSSVEMNGEYGLFVDLKGSISHGLQGLTRINTGN
jgi:hypothetical protein